jgi:flagellar hook-associated protein 3 FlgL
MAMAISGRITDRSIHTRVLANLQRNLAKGDRIQDQLSSGKQINRPSDSPTGTVSSMQLRAESRVNSTQSNEALATEIDQIVGSMVSYANTKYLDRPVFGGTTAKPIAYEDDGTYVGDSGQTKRSVAAGENGKVRVDVNGPDAFGTGTDSVFAVLKSIATNIRNGDGTKLADDLKNLDKAAGSIKTTLSEVGSRYNRITQMRDSAQDRVLSVTSQLSEIEDIDLPKTIMEMQLQQTSYQAALAASAKVIQPSLIDFLR